MRLDTKPHPIRVTSMYILDEALQKMRKVEARQNSEEYNKTLHRWRGIKDRDLDLDTFKRVGGTKLTPLSTTAKRPVAEAFTKGQQRGLIFRKTRASCTRSHCNGRYWCRVYLLSHGSSSVPTTVSGEYFLSVVNELLQLPVGPDETRGFETDLKS
jgi:hypothetical protein